MDQERFTQFRSDFVKFIQFIRNGEDLDTVLNSFLLEYKELTDELTLPNLAKVEDLTMEEASINKEVSVKKEAPLKKEAPIKKKRKPKDMEEITERLMKSIEDKKPWKDFTNIIINIDNEESCLETLKKLDEAEADA